MVVGSLANLNFNERERQALAAKYALLVNQFDALNQQYDECLDAGEQVILQTKIDNIEPEIKALEAFLEEDEPSDLTDKLHYLDFKKIIRQFGALCDDFGRKGGASVLLLQDSAVMAGDLLVKRLREDLDKKASDFKPLPIGFSGDGDLNEVGLLKSMGRYLGLATETSDLDELLEQVIETLCDSLQTRSIVFLEITQWERIPEQESVFEWLCKTFYPRLVSKLSKTVAEKSWRRVYVFIIVVSDDLLPNNCLEMTSSLLADDMGDQGNKIFNVEFDNWTQDDIEDWLEFAGLPGSELESVANRFYRRSRGGMPSIIRNAIEKEFCKA